MLEHRLDANSRWQKRSIRKSSSLTGCRQTLNRNEKTYFCVFLIVCVSYLLHLFKHLFNKNKVTNCFYQCLLLSMCEACHSIVWQVCTYTIPTNVKALHVSSLTCRCQEISFFWNNKSDTAAWMHLYSVLCCE